MAGIRFTYDRDGKRHPHVKYWYRDWKGNRIWKTSRFGDPEKVQAIADAIEDEQRKIKEQVALGIRPEPTTAEQAKPKSISDLVKDYLDLGAMSGGRGGRAWSRTHARMRRKHLEFWISNLGLKTIGDLNGCLAAVEKTLKQLQTRGRIDKKGRRRDYTGKTLQNYAEALCAFCDWAVQRGFLDKDPLKVLPAFDITPRAVRRAMTTEELHTLLEGCPEHRRMVYEVAFCTGLRANELRSLRVGHLDVKRGGLILDPAWTKNRKEGFQPLPSELVQRLQRASHSHLARRIYDRFKGKTKFAKPADALLYVPANPARDMTKDMARLGIEKKTPEGKLDFHAARVAYSTFVFESGASLKEAQSLMRHSDPRLTANVYARTRDEKLHSVAEAIGRLVQPCETSVQRTNYQASPDSIKPADSKGSEDNKMVEAAGIEPKYNVTITQSERDLHPNVIGLRNIDIAATSAPHRVTVACATNVKRDLWRVIDDYQNAPEEQRQKLLDEAELITCSG